MLGENIGGSARMAKDRYGIAEDRYGMAEEGYGLTEERYGLTEDRYPIDLALMLEEQVCAHSQLLTCFTRC